MSKPKNNLISHLSWLRREQPNVPKWSPDELTSSESVSLSAKNGLSTPASINIGSSIESISTAQGSSSTSAQGTISLSGNSGTSIPNKRQLESFPTDNMTPSSITRKDTNSSLNTNFGNGNNFVTPVKLVLGTPSPPETIDLTADEDTDGILRRAKGNERSSRNQEMPFDVSDNLNEIEESAPQEMVPATEELEVEDSDFFPLASDSTQALGGKNNAEDLDQELIAASDTDDEDVADVNNDKNNQKLSADESSSSISASTSLTDLAAFADLKNVMSFQEIENSLLRRKLEEIESLMTYLGLNISENPKIMELDKELADLANKREKLLEKRVIASQHDLDIHLTPSKPANNEPFNLSSSPVTEVDSFEFGDSAVSKSFLPQLQSNDDEINEADIEDDDDDMIVGYSTERMVLEAIDIPDDDDDDFDDEELVKQLNASLEAKRQREEVLEDSFHEILPAEHTHVIETPKKRQEYGEDEPMVWSSPQGVQMSQMELSRVDQQYSTSSHPWSKDVMDVLFNTFKLNGFRHNQLEAVNATLSGKDVLVLMPTGGGKSLCYQLPALVRTGSTSGTTIVISPLISLMQDQIYHLKMKHIKADMINSKCSATERREVLKQLIEGNLDLVYLSPEMLNSSKQIQNMLYRLHDNHKIARIVIDEAHCVSSWGHDFRPDYKLLENLKDRFAGVPIMALTATANERVRLDILLCLRKENTVFLKQSFNRPNLYYEVKEKNKGVYEDLGYYMTKKFPGKSGIIYCHSKNSCETTALKLREWGLKVDFYHAGMDPERRQRVQELWQSGRVTTICATVAFGMGIDKADVRYVIHLTLPRNMEGYYQETGRAGRDGKSSECILYYTYRDATTLMSMIDRDDLDAKDKENHKNLLKRVIQYSENHSDCRRKQILQYFNEVFDSEICKGTCDNCKHSKSMVQRDVTELSKEIIKLVEHIQRDNVTILHCVDVYRGSRARKILELGHDNAPGFGAGKKKSRTEIDRLFHHLVAEGILKEYSCYNKAGFATTYLKRSSSAAEVLAGKQKVIMKFVSSPKEFLQSEREEGPDKPTNNRSTTSTSSSKSRGGKRAPKNQETENQAPKRQKTSGPKRIPSTKNKDVKYEQRYAELEVVRYEIMEELRDSKKWPGIQSPTDICSDEALRIMAKTLPVDLEAFYNLPGMASIKQLCRQSYPFFRPHLVRMSEAGNDPVENAPPSANVELDDSDDEDYQEENTVPLGVKSQYFMSSNEVSKSATKSKKATTSSRKFKKPAATYSSLKKKKSYAKKAPQIPTSTPMANASKSSVNNSMFKMMPLR